MNKVKDKMKELREEIEQAVPNQKDWEYLSVPMHELITRIKEIDCKRGVK